MRLLFLFLLVVLITACSKKNKYCYTCQISGGVPFQTRTLDTCSDVTSGQYLFKDANGNSLSYICQNR